MTRMKRLVLPAAGLMAILCMSALIFTQTVKADSKQANECFDESIPLTPEEQRIEDGKPIPQQIMKDSEFTRFSENFKRELCAAPNAEKAQRVIEKHGTKLWKTAVSRAQGKRPGLGTLDQYDDRPLYWTRLHMTKALRQWKPDFILTDENRKKMMKSFEYTSRGITSIDFPRGKHMKRILVTGFDPYRLEQEFRRSNPSGAAALQMDGTIVRTKDGPAVIQAANFPVRWEDFEEGIVEDTFGPYLVKSREQVDLMMTISQGGPKKMAIEGFAGRWHTGADNDLKERSEVTPPVSHWPMPKPLPEFIETTLPVEAMKSANTGPWPVERNDEVCEWTAPDYMNGEAVCRDGGPTPGSLAREGGGGSYLSNESQYRSNRVRLGLGAYDIPGGHLHVAAQEFYPEDPSVYITEDFRKFRQDTVDQTVGLVEAAARSIKK